MRLRSKFLAYLLVFAMVFGFVTYLDVSEVKAASLVATKTIYAVIDSSCTIPYECVGFNPWSGCDGTGLDKSTVGDWTGPFTMSKVIDGIYKIEIPVYDDLNAGAEVVLFKNDGTGRYNFRLETEDPVYQDYHDAMTSTTSKYVTITCKNTEDIEVVNGVPNAIDYKVVGNTDLTGTSWNVTNENMQMMRNSSGIYEKTIDGVNPGKECEFKVVKGSAWDGDGTASYGDGGNNYKFTLEKRSNVTIKFDPTDSSITCVNVVCAATPEDVDAAIAEIGEVTLSSDSLSKIENAEELYDTVENDEKENVENYNTLTDARTTYNTLAAADVDAKINAIGTVTVDSAAKITEARTAYAALNSTQQGLVTKLAVLTAAEAALQEAQAAAKCDVTIHFAPGSTVSWSTIYYYAFDSSEHNMGAFPGTAMLANSKNSGWYSVSFNLAEGFVEGELAVGFNKGEGGANKQTNNAELKAKGEYWVTLTGETEEDAYKNAVYKTSVSSTAPEGWVTGGSSATNTTATATATPTPAPVDKTVPAKAKFHFKNSESWEKVGIYFTTSDKWTEVTGKWPGEAMTLETDSKTWFEYDYYGTEELYNYIINNMVSDDEAKAGATKVQTLNIEKATAGEYWITLGEKDAEGKFAVNIATTAPSDYDGKGIAAKKEADWTSAKTAITAALAAATDGKTATAEVVMNDSTKVPADILAEIKGKDIDVTFKISDKVSWVVNGKSITDASKELNLGVTVDGTKIAAKSVEKLASTIKCDKTIQLSLDHSGEFGCSLTLKTFIGKDMADKYAVLYYLNPTTNNFEYQSNVKVDADGWAALGFTHASDYVVAVTDDVVTKSVSAKTGDTTSTMAMVIFMLISAAGVLYISRKKKLFA